VKSEQTVWFVRKYPRRKKFRQVIDRCNETTVLIEVEQQQHKKASIAALSETNTTNTHTYLSALPQAVTKIKYIVWITQKNETLHCAVLFNAYCYY